MEPKKLYIACSFAALNDSYGKDVVYDASKSLDNYAETAAKVYKSLIDAKVAKDDERAYCLAIRYCNTFIMLKQAFPHKLDVVKEKLPNITDAVQCCEDLAKVLKARYKDPSQFANADKKELTKASSNAATKSQSVESTQLDKTKKLEQKVPEKQTEKLEKEHMSVNELYQLVKSKKDTILLFDLREESDYALSRLKVPNQINVPESFLKQKQVLTANEIGDCLEEESLSVWNRRNTFENVVFCDWLGADRSFVYGSIFSVLRDCLLKWSPDLNLLVSPRILAGGYTEVIELFPALTTNAKVKKPTQSYKEADSLATKLGFELDPLSLNEPSLPKPDVVKMANGIPAVNRSLKPKPSSTEIPAAKSDSVSSYPDIMRELSKISAKANSVNDGSTFEASKNVELKEIKRSTGSVSEKTNSVSTLKVDRSLKPRLVIPVTEDSNKSEMSRLMEELNAEKENNRRLMERNKLLEQKAEAAESERIKQEKLSSKKEELSKDLPDNNIQTNPSRDSPPTASTTPSPNSSRSVAGSSSIAADATSEGVANSETFDDETSKSRNQNKTVDNADLSKRNSSVDTAKSDSKTYIQTLRDDNSSSLSNKSLTAALKRTNSSPNLAKDVVSQTRVTPASNRARPPSPRRDKKPMGPVLLDVDVNHLKNFQPEYGSVSYGRCGLRNLGNTCYMNACLQCLSHTFLLKEYIIRGKFFEYVNPNNKEGMGGYIVYEFTILLRAIWSNQYKAISPVDIKNAMGRYRKQFRGTDQQDAQELLIALLDGLHEEVNMAGEKRIHALSDSEMANKSDSELAKLYWENYSLNNRSIIVDIFQGQYRSTVQCTVCQKKSTAFDTFMYLSLPIPKGSRPSLFDCFQLYCSPEYIEWNCPQCKVSRKATKKLDIWRWPRYLIIHLKRFEFTTGYSRVKIQSKVDFPMELHSDSRWINQLPNFKLYGVVHHSGGIDRGHYVANVWIDAVGKWHKFDDSIVSLTSQSSVVSETAYLLFYSRGVNS